jgi:hypothetical protein
MGLAPYLLLDSNKDETSHTFDGENIGTVEGKELTNNHFGRLFVVDKNTVYLCE